jgi:hypothetical protein
MSKILIIDGVTEAIVTDLRAFCEDVGIRCNNLNYADHWPDFPFVLIDASAKSATMCNSDNPSDYGNYNDGSEPIIVTVEQVMAAIKG